MVSASWFSRFGNSWRNPWKKSSFDSDRQVIGVLAFEVASLMSKVVHLWQCLKDEQLIRLREEMMTSVGVRKLVSDDEEFLLRLACAEMMDTLGFVVRAVSRLGKKCSVPVLQGFEHLFEDLVKNGADLSGWDFTWKKMERKMKKMEKFVTVSGNLYQEMEVLAELEQGLKRMQGNDDPNRGNFLDFQQKVVWQRQEVKYLREISLWNRSYDYVVRLLARSMITIFGRIRYVFGIDQNPPIIPRSEDMRIPDSLSRSQSVSALSQSLVHPSEINGAARFSSGPLGRSSIARSGPLGRSSIARSGPLGRSSIARSGPLGRSSIARSGPISGPITRIGGQFENADRQPHNILPPLPGKKIGSKTKQKAAPGMPLKGCITGRSGSPVWQPTHPMNNGSPVSVQSKSNGVNGIQEASPDSLVHSNMFTGLSFINSKFKLCPLPSTLGAAGLSLHYANVIIVIEKLVASPHLISPDARDDLYNMLPTSVKAALRARLKTYAKNLASSFYDTGLASEWSDALGRILDWLAPLAHSMVRWQSDRSFEQQHMVSKTNVLLLQTLYFADQAKTEAAITELLVGLNYIWRFERELNAKALLECTSIGEYDDYLDSKT